MGKEGHRRLGRHRKFWATIEGDLASYAKSLITMSPSPPPLYFTLFAIGLAFSIHFYSTVSNQPLKTGSGYIAMSPIVVFPKSVIAQNRYPPNDQIRIFLKSFALFSGYNLEYGILGLLF